MGTPRRQRFYEPKRLAGENLEELKREMQMELDLIADTVNLLSDMQYLPKGKEPNKFEDGSVQYFLGGISVTGVANTSKGLYQFRDGSWRKLQEV